MNVESDGADGIVALELFGFCGPGDGGFGTLVIFEAAEGIVSETVGFALFGLFEPFALAVKDELGVLDQWHAVRPSKLFGAGADEVDVRTLFEDEAGGLDGITKALDTGDSSGLHAASIHEESVKLNAPVGGEKASAPRIEGWIVFQDGDGGLHSVDGGAATRKNGEAGFESLAYAGLVRDRGIVGNGPCSTVNDQNGFVCGSSHPVMVVD